MFLAYDDKELFNDYLNMLKCQELTRQMMKTYLHILEGIQKEIYDIEEELKKRKIITPPKTEQFLIQKNKQKTTRE